MENFFRDRVGSDVSISAIRGLDGGSSKEQYKFTVERITETGDRVVRDHVLQMCSAESIMETHPLREFHALNAVYGKLPVPGAHWVDVLDRCPASSNVSYEPQALSANTGRNEIYQGLA
ncbi:MAG: hypothetical protein WC997_11670 [Porticoccaceae bacterium]